ncbi:MAG: uridine monophosphate kinase [candidate division WOR-3 bacterium]
MRTLESLDSPDTSWVPKETGQDEPPHQPARNSLNNEPYYSRVLLKVTGEAFSTGERVRFLANEIRTAADSGCELAVVVGGGNIIRGEQTKLIDRVSADQAGMVATIVNALILERVLQEVGIAARHYGALEVAGVVPRFSAREVRDTLARGEVVVLSGGTGNPLFSTDTAAALRAREVEAQVILKGTKVRGVFSDDPRRNPKARFLSRVSYDEALRRHLRVMDQTAFSLCAESRIPIVVFQLFKKGNLARVIKGEDTGSRIC